MLGIPNVYLFQPIGRYVHATLLKPLILSIQIVIAFNTRSLNYKSFPESLIKVRQVAYGELLRKK